MVLIKLTEIKIHLIRSTKLFEKFATNLTEEVVTVKIGLRGVGGVDISFLF